MHEIAQEFCEVALDLGVIGKHEFAISPFQGSADLS
jgi:hypothetical protein